MSQKSGVSREVAFDDWLLAMVAALSAGQMEDQYMEMIRRHSAGKPGQRACDLMAQMFGKLVDAMHRTEEDILGDIFTAGITRGQNGQYFTPRPVAELMSRLAVHDLDEEDDGTVKTVSDCCCGSGRMLMEVAREKPHWEFYAQDLDLRCVRITALNMALWNRYAWVVWGNSLTLESKLAYRTGFNLRGGVIREVPVEQCPCPTTPSASKPMQMQSEPTIVETPPTPDDEPPVGDPRRGEQGQLF